MNLQELAEIKLMPQLNISSSLQVHGLDVLYCVLWVCGRLQHGKLGIRENLCHQNKEES